MKRADSTHTASLHYLSSANHAPFPGRNKGRLPRSVAVLSVHRDRRLLRAREAADRERQFSEARITLNLAMHNIAVLAYRSSVRRGVPDTFEAALTRVAAACEEMSIASPEQTA